MPGLLNGLQPDARDLARAPELGSLACLHAAAETAHMALRALHGERLSPFRRSPPGGLSPEHNSGEPTLDAAADLIDAISELRVRLRRYANKRGRDVIW